MILRIVVLLDLTKSLYCLAATTLALVCCRIYRSTFFETRSELIFKNPKTHIRTETRPDPTHLNYYFILFKLFKLFKTDNLYLKLRSSRKFYKILYRTFLEVTIIIYVFKWKCTNKLFFYNTNKVKLICLCSKLHVWMKELLQFSTLIWWSF